MNWNNNDTKYILKRIITYFLISAIIFFIGQRCVKANVISQGASDIVANMGITDSSSQWPVNNFNGAFQNAGQGYVLFTITTSQPASNTTSTWNISEVKVYTGQSYGNPSSQYICDIGTTNYYIDSNKEVVIYSVKCPVNLTNNNKLLFVEARRLITGYILGINISTIYTFVSEQSDANSIISANQQAIQQQINSENANAQAIQNAINTSTQNEINAINSVTQATNDNTQAINDLTDTINAGYNSNTGSDYLNVFDNLFTQEDENVIRQFVMIPFNLYILLYNSITNGSCQSISLGTLYGVDLELPCINYRNIIGVPLYTTIDTIFGACLLFGIIRMIKKFFNSLFTVSSKATDENGIEVFK